MKNLTVLVMFSLLLFSANCKKENGKKKEFGKKKENEKIEDVCDEGDRQRSVLCFCTPSEMNAAKEAVCWVYGTKLTGDDVVWTKFASQPKLEKLKFNIRQDGTLLDIPTKALVHLPDLQSIEIQYGFITELSPFVFANLTSLTEISVPQNQISELRSHAIANLPKLTILNLDANKILELRRESIRDTPNLKLLYLNRNNLSIIHDYAFSHLHRLEELELNTNQISILTRETFAGLKSLRYLDLRKNRLTMIGDHTFDVLENLYELVLDQNNIEYLSDKAFAGLGKLTKLRLSENQLKNLNQEVFKESPKVYLLDLRMNGLETITSDTLKPLWDNLRNHTAHIWLEKNRLKCDCRLSWIHSLRNETENKELKLSLEELTCIVDGGSSETSPASVETPGKPQEDKSYSVDVDAVQYDDEEAEYDEDVASSEYENELGKFLRRKIVDIPVETLPCPEKQQGTTEEAIKSSLSYWPEASSSNMNEAPPNLRPSLYLFLLVVTAFLRNLFVLNFTL